MIDSISKVHARSLLPLWQAAKLCIDCIPHDDIRQQAAGFTEAGAELPFCIPPDRMFRHCIAGNLPFRLLDLSRSLRHD